jgi:hypothetical protein
MGRRHGELILRNLQLASKAPESAQGEWIKSQAWECGLKIPDYERMRHLKIARNTELITHGT